MFALAAIALSITTIVLAAFASTWSWIPPTLCLTLAHYQLARLRRKPPPPEPELSPAANDVLTRYWHWFTFPFAAEDIGRALALHGLATLVAGIIVGAKESWWFALIGFAACLVHGALSKAFYPRHFVGAGIEAAAFKEVAAWLDADGSGHSTTTRAHKRRS